MPVDRWTHLAITWDQATKMAGVYVDGQLDVAEEPEGITEAKLGEGQGGMRLGGHTWAQNPMSLNGQLDEVRISAVARQYQAAAPSKRECPGGRSARGHPNCGGRAAAPKPWATNTDPTDVAKSKVQEITDGDAEVYGGAGRHHGRAKLPDADGLRNGARRGLLPDLGVEPLGADGKRRRDGRRQPLAFQRPEQLPQRAGDRRRRRCART